MKGSAVADDQDCSHSVTWKDRDGMSGGNEKQCIPLAKSIIIIMRVPFHRHRHHHPWYIVLSLAPSYSQSQEGRKE